VSRRDRQHPTGQRNEYAAAECYFCGATTIFGPDNIARLCGECGNPIRKILTDNNTETQETTT
jgi:hypothetical protein